MSRDKVRSFRDRKHKAAMRALRELRDIMEGGKVLFLSDDISGLLQLMREAGVRVNVAEAEEER